MDSVCKSIDYISAKFEENMKIINNLENTIKDMRKSYEELQKEYARMKKRQDKMEKYLQHILIKQNEENQLKLNNKTEIYGISKQDNTEDTPITKKVLNTIKAEEVEEDRSNRKQTHER